MNISLETNDSSQLLQTNAERVSLVLLASMIIGTSIATYIAWSSDQFFIYYYVALFCLVGILYGIGTIFIFRKKKYLGVGFLLTGLILAFLSIPVSFINVGPSAALIIGFVSWLISILTLERKPQIKATIIGLFFAFVAIGLDIFTPTPRIFLSATSIATLFVGGSMIVVMLGLFILSFRAFQILTKLVVITVTIVLFATTIPILIITQSTRNALIQSTQVEIELRGERVSSEISTQLESHVNRLRTLVTNQRILDLINADTQDLDELLERDDGNIVIVNQILDRRNLVWQNESEQFFTQQHFPFFSKLRNPAADILRNFKFQSIPTEEVFIVNKYGAVVAMADKDDTPAYLYADTDWWEQILIANGRETYVGNPMPIKNGTRLAIPVAVPILDINNNLIGAIYTTYSTNQLIGSLGVGQIEASAAETNFSLVIDENRLLPLIRGQNNFISNEFALDLIQSLFAMNFIEIRSLESNNVLTAVPITSLDDRINMPANWGVLVSRPLEAVEQIIQQQQQTQIFIGIALALVGILMARLISGAVSSPISKLANVANELESGNLDARADVESADEVGRLSIAFNQMADQSQRLVNQLESRVKERTQALETSFRVSQTISSINETKEIVEQVVDQLQAAYDYYHVHIYLLDGLKGNLRMMAGSGETGKLLMSQGHNLEIGQGLVGRAVIENDYVLVSDVSKDEQWVANPMLPETKSELAVPISLGSEILGVIDVQDDEINRFSSQDADLLAAIADQVAVALRNASRYESAKDRADRELRLNEVREKILKTQDVESAMKTAVREISQLLGNKGASIHLAPRADEVAQSAQIHERTTKLKDNGQSGNSKTHLNGHSNGSQS